MNRAEIVKMITEDFAEIMEVDPATIEPHKSLVDDYAADSLTLIELAEAIERVFEIPANSVDEDDLLNIRTINDAADLVERILKNMGR